MKRFVLVGLTRVARPRLVAAATAALLGACYEYVPVVAQDPTPGAGIRLTLSDAGSVAATSAVGPHVELVAGRVSRIDADSVVVIATYTRQRNGVESRWRAERVAVPRAGIASLDVPRLSAARTGLGVAFGVATAVATIATVTAASSFAHPHAPATTSIPALPTPR